MLTPLHQGRRQLFNLLKVERGQTVAVTSGHDCTIANVHWTPAGTRQCKSNRGKDPCIHCACPQTPDARVTIYLAVWPVETWKPHLLILSELAVPWATDAENLVRRQLLVTRGRKTNRIITVDEGPAVGETPGQPLCRWLATLWNQN